MAGRCFPSYFPPSFHLPPDTAGCLGRIVGVGVAELIFLRILANKRRKRSKAAAKRADFKVMRASVPLDNASWSGPSLSLAGVGNTSLLMPYLNPIWRIFLAGRQELTEAAALGKVAGLLL
ncbi:hypothetical protein NXC12_PE00553 (plasmid) [Rhizobium etli]|uniref:Uncharacterized protein n=1 Tax=Rhizobium etli TaxID=29449 RepID=A0AAN1BMY2_RHIET|nr:hypothetical protein [Rhizobium etli]AGS26160.1 hypothetical protein REMIM1_PF00495 [Rhizobium etli bv. mimosae str. Mim1]ARQ14148.1 hypothetical protein NXC12_PE00553 [Rhizobium etli]